MGEKAPAEKNSKHKPFQQCDRVALTCQFAVTVTLVTTSLVVAHLMLLI
ncbi:MAG: hypothetical protein AB1589_44535 [Cyanobacteriota bacterium]